MNERIIFCAGTCPAGPGAGELIVLINKENNSPIFFCPSCGTAWEKHPGEKVDEVNSIDEVAPKGVQLPSKSEIKELNLADKIVEEYPYKDWDFVVDEILSNS